MAYLQFYQKERELYPEAHKRKLKYNESDIVFRKLKKHFKLHYQSKIRYTKRKGGCCIYGYYSKWSIIEVPYYTSFGMLCHEIAHAIDHQRRGKSKHDKKLAKIVNQVINYCKKQDWWRTELDSRNEIERARQKQRTERMIKKENKLEITKQAQKEKNKETKAEKNTIKYKLQKTKEAIRRWETKKKRAETYLKKLNKQKRRYDNIIEKREVD